MPIALLAPSVSPEAPMNAEKESKEFLEELCSHGVDMDRVCWLLGVLVAEPQLIEILQTYCLRFT